MSKDISHNTTCFSIMKLFLSLLPATIVVLSSCFCSVQGKILEGNVQLQLLVGIETRLDHTEMNRIFSNPSHHQEHKADKVALLKKAKAHVGECVELFQSSIDHHNNKITTRKERLELLSFSKDGSRFYITGSVEDFTLYFKKTDTDNEDEDNDNVLISFDETTTKQNEFEIMGKYDHDGRTATTFSSELEECIGLRSFHRRTFNLNADNRNADQIEIGNDGYESRMLKPISTNNDPSPPRPPTTPPPPALSGSCPYTNDAIESFLVVNPISQNNFYAIPGQIQELIPPANASLIRNIYGVPTVDGTCYNPRDSAVFEAGQYIGIDEFACYNQVNGLQNTLVQPVPINQTLNPGFPV